MVSWTTTPFAGSIKIVSKDQVESLDVKMSKLTETLSQWGIGTKNLIMEKPENPKLEK